MGRAKPATIKRKMPVNESINLIRLKQTAKLNQHDEANNEKTIEAIKKAEKDIAMDLLLVDEMIRDVKLLNVISAIETDCLEKVFYLYRQHREHLTLTTRFGLLFCNDKIVIPEAMRTSIIAMLHQGHVALTKMDKSAEAFCRPGLHREIMEKSENCPSCGAAGKNLKTQIPQTEVNGLELLTVPNQEIQLDFAGAIKSKTHGNMYFSSNRPF